MHDVIVMAAQQLCWPTPILFYYIRQVNGVKLADILFSLLFVCVSVYLSVCAHSHRRSQILSSAFLPFPSLPFLSLPIPSLPFTSPLLTSLPFLTLPSPPS